MSGDRTNAPDLAGAIVRLCPACGVVNPSGPSAGCPHVQLIRFDGVTPELADLLARVAEARREYNDLSRLLRETALAAVRDSRAAVETPTERAASAGADDARRPRPIPERLALEAPGPRRPAADSPRPRPRRRGPPPVDARQLDLLARGPAKGEA